MDGNKSHGNGNPDFHTCWQDDYTGEAFHLRGCRSLSRLIITESKLAQGKPQTTDFHLNKSSRHQ